MAFNLSRFNPFGNVTNYDPFRDFDHFFKEFEVPAAWREMEAAPRIKLDVSENDNAYTVKAEIPGFKKEDIKVSIDGNQVSISAESKSEKEEKNGETVIRRERYYGQQFRSFTLANAIDEDKSSAKYQDGILELTLPKQAGSTTKQLAVN